MLRLLSRHAFSIIHTLTSIGARWACDLGAASYGLPGYWDKSTANGHRYSCVMSHHLSFCLLFCFFSRVQIMYLFSVWVHRAQPFFKIILKASLVNTENHKINTHKGISQDTEDTVISEVIMYNNILINSDSVIVM